MVRGVPASKVVSFFGFTLFASKDSSLNAGWCMAWQFLAKCLCNIQFTVFAIKVLILASQYPPKHLCKTQWQTIVLPCTCLFLTNLCVDWNIAFYSFLWCNDEVSRAVLKPSTFDLLGMPQPLCNLYQCSFISTLVLYTWCNV